MKILLFGGNRLKEDGPLGRLAVELSKNDVEFIVFTDKAHLEMQTQSYPTFEAQLRAENISYQVIDTLKLENIRTRNSEPLLGLCVNANWIFSQEIIQSFSGRLYNYHNAALPQERGAAVYTWKILMQSKSTTLTIHKIISQIDAGEIVDERIIDFLPTCKRPLDFFKMFLWGMQSSTNQDGFRYVSGLFDNKIIDD